MNLPVSVLVVGAGPIGLALACHLRRMGVSCRLIEKRSGPSVHSKAIGLQYRVSEVLARLGVIDQFVKEGGSPTTVNIYAADERLIQLRFVTPSGICGRDAFCPRAILIPQSRTEAILAELFEQMGGRVEWTTELTDYEQSSDGVIAQVQKPNVSEEIVAEWLVSCEGAHSVVRRKASMEFRGKTYPLAFFMADVRMKGTLSHAENHVWLHTDGSLAALPLPDHDTGRLFVEVTSNQSNEPATLDAIHRLMAQRAPDIDATIVGEPLWVSDFRINCRMVDHMRDGASLSLETPPTSTAPPGDKALRPACRMPRTLPGSSPEYVRGLRRLSSTRTRRNACHTQPKCSGKRIARRTYCSHRPRRCVPFATSWCCQFFASLGCSAGCLASSPSCMCTIVAVRFLVQLVDSCAGCAPVTARRTCHLPTPRREREPHCSD